MRYRKDILQYKKYIKFRSKILENLINTDETHLIKNTVKLIFNKISELNINYELVNSPAFYLNEDDYGSGHIVKTTSKNERFDTITPNIEADFISRCTMNFINTLDTNKTLYIYSIECREYTHNISPFDMEPIILGPGESYERSLLFKIRTTQI